LHLLHKIISETYNHYEGSLTTFLNLHSYRILRSELFLYKQFHNIYIDGLFLQILFNVVYWEKKSRVSFDFTSLAEKVFSNAEGEGKTIFLIGSKANEIARSTKNIISKYPDLKLAGFRHGYFESRQEYIDLIKKIVLLNPDFVIAGMGTPLQEKFLLDLKLLGWQGTGFTCGGFLHQTASKTKYYPDWINKLNLRWAYRIYDEPYLIKRYSIDYLMGLFLFIKDYYKGKKGKIHE
jgi:exopolysaccharide biosynthesis WecB/TagA/CpsF family protein